MRGMGQIIAWSINDETLHTESMIKLFREYIEQNPQLWNDDLKSTIYSIAEKMVELEDRFIDLAFGVNQMQKLAKEDVPVRDKGYYTEQLIYQRGLYLRAEVENNILKVAFYLAEYLSRDCRKPVYTIIY